MCRKTRDDSVLDRAEPLDRHGDDISDGERRRILFAGAPPELEQTAVSASAGCDDVTRAYHGAAAGVGDHLGERPDGMGQAVGSDELVIDEDGHREVMTVATPVTFE